MLVDYGDPKELIGCWRSIYFVELEAPSGSNDVRHILLSI
jgi:thiamine phosphate synthase YjbQ (UPF0047 family)